MKGAHPAGKEALKKRDAGMPAQRHAAGKNATFQFADKRDATLQQRSLQSVVHNSPQVQKALQMKAMATHFVAKQASRDETARQGASVPSGQGVLQAVWHYVEETGRERRYNLTTNQDGTFTYSKTQVKYQDIGKKTKNGDVLLTPINSSGPTLTSPLTTSTTTTHDPKNVLFAIREDGKIEYLGNTENNRKQNAGKYMEMSPTDFAIFKSGGKRSGSSKVMDPVTLSRYHYDGKKFFNWNKDRLDGKGKLVDEAKASGQKQSPQEILAEKLKNQELVDRRREDRTGQDLLPFDVGPYKSNVEIPKESNQKLKRTFENLSKFKAWTTTPSHTNRDHVPSGESMNERGGDGAYNTAFAIAIPNKEMHQIFSPTFGTDNSHENGMIDEMPGGKKNRRVKLDSLNPALALYKDISYMLSKTLGQDNSTIHRFLNLTMRIHRARQLGAYRHLFRRNVRMNKYKGKKYGIDPSVKGFDYTVGKRIFKKKHKNQTKREGAFTYTEVTGKTQGRVTSDMFGKHLANENIATRI